MARRKGQAPKRLPTNVVIEAIAAAGGQTAVAHALGISAPTLARWRKAKKIEHDAVACLELARLAASAMRRDPWNLARRLAGLED